jgi:hypothetical protein
MEVNMLYEVKLWRSLFKPHTHFYQLERGESIRGFRPRLYSLLLISMIIFWISGLVGIGFNPVSTMLHLLSPSEYEVRKFWFSIGRLLLGLLFATIVIVIPSLFYWTISEVSFKKLMVLQLPVLLIFLIGKIVSILFVVLFGLDWSSSPLSLGVIAQAFTHNQWVIPFFGAISLFQIWAICFQYTALKILSPKSPKILFFFIAGVHLLFWIFTATLAYIDLTAIIHFPL